MAAEKTVNVRSGYLMLFLGIILVAFGIYTFVEMIRFENIVLIVPFFLMFFLGILTLAGLFIVNPNDSRVLILFGIYKGTVKKNGFCWANPFMTKKKITLRARNLNGDKIKVNDKAGNPIEIAAVVVWQVADTFHAAFEVDDLVERASPLRASCKPFDTFDEHASVPTPVEYTHAAETGHL